MNMKILKYGVCAGRHDLPVEDYIFPAELSSELIADPETLQEMALEKLMAAVSDCETELELYVTGLTVAVIAVIEAAKKLDLPVTLYHYNKVKGEYYAQHLK